jgi:hypothetical protein
MRAMAPFQGRPRRSTTVFEVLARWLWSNRLICSSGRRPTGSRWVDGGGEVDLRVVPKPRAFNRAASPGEGFRTRWVGVEVVGELVADGSFAGGVCCCCGCCWCCCCCDEGAVLGGSALWLWAVLSPPLASRCCCG